jgi:uncharacterized protein (TIGR02466 family)
MSQVFPLFSTPLYSSFISQENLHGVLDYAKTCIFEDGPPGNVSITSEDYIIDKLPRFKNSIIEKVNDYFLNYLKLAPSLSYYFPDSWFVKITPRSASSRHSHANSLFSGVVYIDSENKGDITFFHPNCGGSLGSNNVRLSYIENNLNNLDHWIEKPENGKILIFPSYLQHKIHINFNDSDRYSFAFNILLENYRCNAYSAKVLER